MPANSGHINDDRSVFVDEKMIFKQCQGVSNIPICSIGSSFMRMWEQLDSDWARVDLGTGCLGAS